MRPLPCVVKLIIPLTTEDGLPGYTEGDLVVGTQNLLKKHRVGQGLGSQSR